MTVILTLFMCRRAFRLAAHTSVSPMSKSMASSTVYFANDGDFEDKDHFESLLGGTRKRRIGGNQSYRDDPNAPPSRPLPQQENQKDLPLVKRFYSSCVSCLRRCGCSSYSMVQQEGPDGLYYRDDFNDFSWTCKAGTSDDNGIWMNTSDQAGIVMACLVWLLLVYSALTISFLAATDGIPPFLSMVYTALCGLALASHAKTTLTDPGAVPISAVPTELQRRHEKLSMCSQCQTFKPPLSHHCRICNRCISRMDHHCPWMNNCIGAGNMKHFLLFLIYIWTCSVFSLCLLGWNYFFCDNEECMFNPVLTQLVRIMTLLSVGSFLFTSSMLMNVCYGLMTGVGTIDRLKKKATNTVHYSDEEPIPLEHVFGIAGFHTWPFPMDPVFEDYDQVMGYSTPQRLLREQMRASPQEDQSLGMSIGEYSPV